MAKIEKASIEIEEMVDSVAEEMGFNRLGLEFLVFNVKKAKEPVKIKRADEVTEVAIKKEDVLIVFVYEKAFDKVDKKEQLMWIRGEMEKVSYDYERDKISLNAPMLTLVLSHYQKYGEESLQNAELALHVIQQIEEEEKQRKAEEKALKKTKKRKKF